MGRVAARAQGAAQRRRERRALWLHPIGAHHGGLPGAHREDSIHPGVHHREAGQRQAVHHGYRHRRRRPPQAQGQPAHQVQDGASHRVRVWLRITRQGQRQGQAQPRRHLPGPGDGFPRRRVPPVPAGCHHRLRRRRRSHPRHQGD